MQFSIKQFSILKFVAKKDFLQLSWLPSLYYVTLNVIPLFWSIILLLLRHEYVLRYYPIGAFRDIMQPLPERGGDVHRSPLNLLSPHPELNVTEDMSKQMLSQRPREV